MELAANDFEWQVKQAEATYADLKVKLQSKTFDQQSVVDTTAERPEAGRTDQGARRAASEAEPEGRYRP